ncbi:NUDIX hydrolase [filamentous cyanobacterium CCP5]|nr:NUDIX hydrolase [filamentous cyanobacterium CCP5]
MRYFWYAVRVLLGLILRHPILGTSVIPILPDGTIVLIRRRDSGRWGLAGGIVDWGEDILTAASRELQEETGLTIRCLDRLVGVYSQPHRDPRFHSVCVAIAAQVDGVPEAKDSREVVDIQAFSPDTLPQHDLSHDHAQQLADYFRGKTVVT